MSATDRSRAHYGYSSFHKDEAERHALVNGDSYITATDHPKIGTKVFLKDKNGWSVLLRRDGTSYSADGKTRDGAEKALLEKYEGLDWKITER
ncbi:hypothetical protein [Mycobacterium asiaticum]|uniref:hypothetical protein n=1 Tax=Mycobacterium asiaticum TaxID=1790 RepID=UPI0007EFBC14|nr:hypothetical protein [Mycobacterium asiaticum]OBI88137.1 hypothetical protein A5661_06190 [Mycobacterium asiaticum]